MKVSPGLLFTLNGAKPGNPITSIRTELVCCCMQALKQASAGQEMPPALKRQNTVLFLSFVFTIK